MKTANPMFGKRLDQRFEILERQFIVRVRVDGENIEPMQREIALWHRFPGFTFMSDDDVATYREQVEDGQSADTGT